jgi:hypothetical protein
MSRVCRAHSYQKKDKLSFTLTDTHVSITRCGEAYSGAKGTPNKHHFSSVPLPCISQNLKPHFVPLPCISLNLKPHLLTLKKTQKHVETLALSTYHFATYDFPNPTALVTASDTRSHCYLKVPEYRLNNATSAI